MSRVGWVVDVQHDFMTPAAEGGRLYVHDLFDAADPGAVQALPAIARAAAWMRARCDVTVFTGDWHAHGDREIDAVAPDATKATYPPHCMGLSDDPAERAGAALVAAVAPEDPLVLGRDASPDEARRTAERALAERRAVFVHKHEFSVFEGNPGADAFVRALADGVGGDPEFVVCGVATDVCVKAAVDGLLARARRVAVVTDATWGLGLERDEALFARWAASDARLVTSDQLDRLDAVHAGG